AKLSCISTCMAGPLPVFLMTYLRFTVTPSLSQTTLPIAGSIETHARPSSCISASCALAICAWVLMIWACRIYIQTCAAPTTAPTTMSVAARTISVQCGLTVACQLRIPRNLHLVPRAVIPRATVALVALLNLGYFGVEFAVALTIGYGVPVR